MTDTYGARLTLAITEANTDQSELARFVGVKPQTVQAACNATNGSRHTAQMAYFLGVNPLWLETGRGAKKSMSPYDIEVNSLAMKMQTLKEDGALTPDKITIINSIIQSWEPTDEKESDE